MNRAHFGFVLCTAVVAVASPDAAQAQRDELRFDCVRAQVEGADAAALGVWAPLRPSAVAKRLEKVRVAGRWSALADSLRVIYGSAPAELSALTANERAAIAAELDTLRSELARGEADPVAHLNGAITDRFHQTVGMSPLTYTLFSGRRNTTQVSIDSATPQATRRTVCWLGSAASDVVEQYRKDAESLVDVALAKRVKRWDNFMNRGYSMLPHELLINGWLPRKTLEPPSKQLILAHPSAGTMIVASSVKTLRDSHREDVLTLEPIGMVVYNGDRSRYGGASLLLTFPNARGLGVGGMLHLSQLGHVAFVNRPREADGVRRNGLLISLDLYHYVIGAADKWKQLRDKAVQVCIANPVECVRQAAP
jgi:hypothetical protein